MLLPMIFLCRVGTAQTIAWRVTDGVTGQAVTNNLVSLFTSEPDGDVQYRLIKIDAPTATRVNVNASPNSSFVGNWMRYAPASPGTLCSAASVSYNTYPATYQTVTPLYLCLSSPHDSAGKNTLLRGYYASFISFTPSGGSPLALQVRLNVSPNGYLQLSSKCSPQTTCADTTSGDLNDQTFNYNVTNSVADPPNAVYAVVVAPDNPAQDRNGLAKVQTGKALQIGKYNEDGQDAPWVTVSVLNPGSETPQASPVSSALLRIGIDPTRLPQGQTDVRARVQIDSGGAFQGEGNIYINTHVNLPAAVFSVDTTPIVFSFPNGSLTQTLSPRSSGAPIAYVASAISDDGTGWLSVNPTSGNTPNALTVSANVTSSRSPGTYTGNITVTPISPAGPQVMVRVTLQVNATTFRLAGTVSDAKGVCSSGVTIGLTGPTNTSAVTAGDGSYSFNNIPGGSYVVTPSKTGCTFSPPTAPVNLTSNILNNNFTGAQSAFTLHYPLNGATGIAPNSTLTWAAVSGASSYDVYFGAANAPLVANVSGTSWQITGASPNVTYTWRVVAIAGGTALSNSDTWSFTTGSAPTSSGLYFFPITPCHLVDTRPTQASSGPFGPPIVEGTQTRTFYPASGSCPGISPSAKAYSFTVTARPTNVMPFLTIWPAGQSIPDVSTLNAFAGGTVSNAAIVPAGDGGGINVYVTNQAHVAIDINGYFDSVASDGATAFYPLPPCRISDTRDPNGPFGGPRLAAGASRDFPVATKTNCIPTQTNASAYSLNVTVAPAEPLDYVVAYSPAISQPPSVITIGSPSKAILADATIVQASGPNGNVRVFASNQTDVLLDVNGYFGASSGSGALVFHPLPPCRVVNTRDPTLRPLGGPIMPANIQRTYPFADSNCGIPKEARAYSLNVTVQPNGVLSFVTLFPTGQARPGVSTLNDFTGTILANSAIVPAGQNGSIDVYVTDATHVIIDINGYFAAQ
jgi:hypothetical protein